MQWIESILGVSAGGIIISLVGTLWAIYSKYQIESLKSRLKLVENEASIRLQKLVDKQLETMIDLYEKMSDLDGNLQYYSGPWNWVSLSNDKEFELLFNNICSFQSSFYKAKVFLTPELEAQFVKLIEVAQRIKVVYRMLKDEKNFHVNTTILDDRSVEDMHYICNELPILRNAIECEYRKIWQISS